MGRENKRLPPAQIPSEQLARLEAFYRDKRFSELIQQGEKLALAHPGSPLLWNVVGSANMALRQFEEARACFTKALALRPDYPDALNNMGLVLRELGLFGEAIAPLKRGVELAPYRTELLSNLGIAYRDAGSKEEARDCLTRAIALDPRYAFAHQNLGVLHQDLGQRDEAIRCFSRVLAIDPTNDRARALRLIEQAHICDWEAMAEDLPRLSEIGIAGDPIPPSILINIDDNPERNFVRAERYAHANYAVVQSTARTPPTARPQRLRLGYFSADFHEHATMHLMARLFELHDRERFEVRAFSFGPETGDAMRVRAKGAVDRFYDVRALAQQQIADLSRSEGIDIAVDLKGDTTDSRFGIFALRPAPIQIAYLGFPGTMGASFIDYIIADRTVLPERNQHFFTEKPIYLPHSYQANDDTRPISDTPMTRAGCGLPENAFVFCSFNNSFKITPAEFDVWMRLLRQTEPSVLWLLRTNRWAEANLKREAAKRGVDPNRLVFAERVHSATNLARQRLADLFLDTFACNAHTTASDALWAGLPVLTKPGKAFGARVATSVLKAIDLPELIASSVDEYEALALGLAREPARLAAIKQKLVANRLSSPLFNSALFTRHIEQAFDAAYQRYLEGKAPDVIEISA